MKSSFLSLLIFISGTCYAQVPNIKIQKEDKHFYLNEVLIGNLNYYIINNDNVPVWLWFSKEDASLVNDSLKVRRYYKLPSSLGDGSYYQWMCDGNVGTFVNSLFSTFGKVIQPKEKFYISFTYQNADVSIMATIIDTHLNIVSEKEIIKQCPGIETEAVKGQFTFQSSIICIPWDYFSRAICREAD